MSENEWKRANLSLVLVSVGFGLRLGIAGLGLGSLELGLGSLGLRLAC